jgi:hypothetical protein
MGVVLEQVLTYGRRELQLDLERAAFVRTETLPALRAVGGVLRDFHRYERRFA